MQNTIKYSFFSTDRGYFGLAADDFGIIRSVLPQKTKKICLTYLLVGINQPTQKDEKLFTELRKMITAYFTGTCVDFKTVKNLSLNHLSPFTQKVLNATRSINDGNTATYTQITHFVNSPNAARAVGNALAKNPLPLLIPCHRIIKSDGSVGGFTAAGNDMKQKLLNLEKARKGIQDKNRN